MIQINQIKIELGHTNEKLEKKVLEFLRISMKEIETIEIVKQSIDARKKPEIFFMYSVNVKLKNEIQEEKIYKKLSSNSRFKNRIQRVTSKKYQFPSLGVKQQKHRIVVVGSGPAGLFCAYYLALHGYAPILLERGNDVDERQKDVETFWETGRLNINSNVQFGEGGAGTFSDGKLNTLVKDKYGKNRAVLETFVTFGAKESILYEAKPHVGTDVLRDIVKNMRQEIIRLGGQVHFKTQLTDLVIEEEKLKGIVVKNLSTPMFQEESLECDTLVLAIGHSARDTFSMLYKTNIPMEAKSFAVGFRVAHPQDMINESQYGKKQVDKLGAAAYKVTAKSKNGRSVYSFCMCPGGYVVNASSEEGRLAVNGMSYSGRDSEQANSAIIVSVSTEDFQSEYPLAGLAFQQELEEKAYALGQGRIPVQRYDIFKNCVQSHMIEKELDSKIVEEARKQGQVPNCKGAYCWADLSQLLPDSCNQAFIDGMESFGRQIKGFDRGDTILMGVESRTSSPIRINRKEDFQSEIQGIYPCGEGAGYAGGITSAAMDGMRVAEMIASVYAPWT